MNLGTRLQGAWRHWKLRQRKMIHGVAGCMSGREIGARLVSSHANLEVQPRPTQNHLEHDLPSGEKALIIRYNRHQSRNNNFYQPLYPCSPTLALGFFDSVAFFAASCTARSASNIPVS